MSNDCRVFHEALTKVDYDSVTALFGENVTEEQRIDIVEKYMASLVDEATQLKAELGIKDESNTDSEAWVKAEAITDNQSESTSEDTEAGNSKEAGLVTTASESSSGYVSEQGSKAPTKPTVRLEVLGYTSENKTAVGDHLTQRGGGLLTTVKGAFTNLFTKPDALTDYVKDKTGKDISAEAKVLATFADSVDKLLTKTSLAGIPLLSPTYFVSRNIQGPADKLDSSWLREFVVSPQPGEYQLDDNLKAAITYVAFKYLGELANKPRPKYKEVAQFLGIEEDDVTRDIYQQYKDKLLHPNTMYNEAGAYVMSAMGMSLKADGSPNVSANIQTAFGGLVYQVLRSRKLIQVASVDAAEYAKLTKTEVKAGTERKFFYQLNPEAKQVYTPLAKAYKSSKFALSTAMAPEGETQYPSTKPIKELPTVTKASTKIPAMLKDVLEKFQATPFFVKENKVEFLKSLGTEFTYSLLGSKTEEQIAALQLMERDGAEAASDAIRKEVDMLFDVTDNMTDAAYGTGLYLKTSLWPSLRVGITSSINPTGSKVHRYLLKGKDWNTEIKFNDSVMVQNFMLRIAEGFGVPTDKQANAVSIATATPPEVMLGVKAIQEAITNKPFNKEHILLAIDKVGLGGAERTKTYDAMYAYAEYLNAKEEGLDSFSTDLMGEIDGVSNGPIMTMLTYGVLAGGLSFEELFAKGGFYTDDNKDFNVWHGKGNKDFYKDAASAMAKAIADYRIGIEGPEKAFIDALAYFAKDESILTRKRSKDAINPLTFGSALDKAANGVLLALLGEIPAAIRNADTQEKLDVLVGHLKALGLDVGSPTRESMLNSFELTKPEVESVLKKYESSLSLPIQDALKEYFGEFLEARNGITTASKVSFNIYSTVRKQLEEEAIAKLTQVNGAKPIGLSKETIAEIDKQLLDMGITPMMGNLYSQVSGNQEENLVLLKTETGPSDDPTYGSQLTGPFAFTTGYATHIVAHSNKKNYVDVGVLGTSVGTHSADSYASFKTAEALFAQSISSFNMHDSRGTGLPGMLQMAKAFNQATWTWATEYNPTVAVAEMAAKNAEAYLDMALKEPTKYRAIAIAPVLDILASSTQNRIAQLEGLLNVKHVSQYALEGGSYSVTQADIAKVQELLVEAKKKLETNKALSNKLEEKSFDLHEIQSAGELTPFQEMLLKAKEGVSLDSLLEVMSKSEKAFEYHKLLADMLKGSKTTVYNVGTLDNIKNTAHKEALTAKYTELPAAVYIDGTIYLFDATGTLVLHEALHSALSQHLLDIEAGKVTDKASVDNYNEIKNIYDTVKAGYEEEVKLGTQLPRTIGFALENLDEFIAYGLTDKNVQQYLSTIPFIKEKTNTFKAFVKSIGKVIKDVFGLQEEPNETALTALLDTAAQTIALSKKEASPDIRAVRGSNGLSTHSTQEIFDALVDPNKPLRADTTAHLKTLLNSVTSNLYGAFGTYPSSIMEDVATDEEAAFLEALQSGYAPVATAIRNENLNLSDQESFVVDQVAVTIGEALAQPDMFKYHRTLEKLYAQAQKEVTPDAFLTNPQTASAAEKKAAADLHGFIFNSAATDGQALIRFAAFGLASEQVINALNGVTTQLPDVKLKHSLFSKLTGWFSSVVNFFVSRRTGVTSNQSMKANLDTLVRRLVLEEAKRQKQVKAPSKTEGINKWINTATRKATVGAVKGVHVAAGSRLVKGLTKNIPVVRALPSLIRKGTSSALMLSRLPANVKVVEKFIGGNMMSVRNANFAGPLGLTASMVNEVLGETDIKQRFFGMLRMVKHVESTREKHIENVSRNTLEAFDQSGANLTKEQLGSLSTLLRTGVSGTAYTPAQVANLLSNPKALERKIASLKTKLTTEAGKYFGLLNYKAEALGYKLMVGEEADVSGGSSNALNIVRMSGTTYQGKLATKEAALTPLVYDLVTLYAFKHMDSVSKKNALDVTNTEVARGTDNGIQFITAMHKNLTKDAKEKLFNNQEGLMQHGYLPEVVNPRVNVVNVTSSTSRTLAKQVEIYKKAGYRVYGTGGRKDITDDKADSVLMVHDNLPETRRLTQLLSVLDNGSKGTSYVEDVNDPLFGAIGQAKVQNVLAKKQQELAKLRSNGFIFTPPTTKLMTALTDENGNVVNFRYQATTKFRDNVLQRNNNVAHLLGKLQGTTYEKVTSAKHNTNIVDALHDLYKTGYTGHERDFMLVGPKATSKEYREAYYLLPKATREYIEDTWGDQGMFVRKDMLDLVFGYKKLNAGDSILKSKAEQSLVIKQVTKLAEFVYARKGGADEKYAARLKASVMARQFQRGWEELVSETKDIIVLRTGIVLMGNTMSNLSFLKLKGLGIKEIFEQQAKGLEALNVYREQAEELDKLETYIATGTRTNEHPQFIKRIGLLKEAMSKNPVKELIDDGFMPSIVEDVETASDDYSYKEQFLTYLGKKTKRLPKLAKETAKQLYMSEDTSMHKFMKYSTQVSDFTARYALNEHLKKDKTISKEDRYTEVSESFVFYDVASHRMLEAGNAVGLIMFTKYIMRIQKPLMEAIRKNPTNALMLWLVDHYFSAIEVITESSFTERFYNPLKTGALQYPFVLGEQASYQAATSVASSLVPGD